MRIGTAFNWTLGLGAAWLQGREFVDDLHKAHEQNQSMLWAGTKSAVKLGWQPLLMWGVKNPMLGWLGLSAIIMAPPLLSAGAQYIRQRNDWIRSAATPFSQKFEHTQWTSQAQQRGLQSISGARSLIGMEAASFASRYGRR
jgi:hypothetical protein